MYYKIVGVNSNCPENPGVYKGEITPKDTEHPLLTALAAEFGDEGEESGVIALKGWSGGESEQWAKDLSDEADDCDNWEFFNDDTTFYVQVSDNPI